MNKKNKITALASATLTALVLTTAFNSVNVSAKAGEVTRTSGANRYETAAQVATKNWTTSDNVILVSGEDYPDAVSASALAKKLNAPLLLTPSKTLDSNTNDALNTLKPKNIYVVGGNASVSQEVRNSLKSKYTLIELAGKDRYATNAAVAEKLVELGVDPTNVMLVGGEGFSDALSVAPVAASKGQILLLGLNNNTYIKPVSDFVKNHKSSTTVVGTVNVINNDIYTAVNGVKRVDGGKDRFDTNLRVLDAFKSDLKMDKAYVANASGDGYADALVASALAGNASAPLVIVDSESSTATTNAISYLKSNITATTDLQVVGGTGVVSENTISKINAVVPAKPVDPNPSTTMPKATIDSLNSTIPFTTIVLVSLDTTTPEKYNVSIKGVSGQLTTTSDNKKVFVFTLNNTYTKDQLTPVVTAK